MNDKTHDPRRRRISAWLGAGAAGALLGSAELVHAAEDKLELVKIILGVPPGSLVDQVARQVGEILETGYATTALVENRTGASGIMAVSAVKQAAPDGRTLLVAASSPITVYPETYKKLPYDPQKDLIPVSTVVTFDLALAVGPMVPDSVTTLKAFYAWCKANPDKASFGSPAAGSTPHFLGSMTARGAGVELQHIPYRGPNPAVIDLLGGRVAAVVVPLVDVAEFAKQPGKARILAVTGDKRSRFVPEVATFAEQGLGEYAMRVWIGAFVPAGTKAALVRRLSATLKSGLASKAATTALERNADVAWSTPEALQQVIKVERAKWAAAAKALNFTSDT